MGTRHTAFRETDIWRTMDVWIEKQKKQSKNRLPSRIGMWAPDPRACGGRMTRKKFMIRSGSRVPPGGGGDPDLRYLHNLVWTIRDSLTFTIYL